MLPLSLLDEAHNIKLWPDFPKTGKETYELYFTLVNADVDTPFYQNNSARGIFRAIFVLQINGYQYWYHFRIWPWISFCIALEMSEFSRKKFLGKTLGYPGSVKELIYEEHFIMNLTNEKRWFYWNWKLQIHRQWWK